MTDLLNMVPNGLWLGVYFGMVGGFLLGLGVAWLIQHGKDDRGQGEPEPHIYPLPPLGPYRATPSIPFIVNGVHDYDCPCMRCRADRVQVNRITHRAMDWAFLKEFGRLPAITPLYPSPDEAREMLATWPGIYVVGENAHQVLQ